MSCASSTAGRWPGDNTVKFQLHTLQLLPEPERPSYAGTVVEVLEGLDGRLRVRHEGTHHQRPGGAAQPCIPPHRPGRFGDSSRLTRRSPTTWTSAGQRPSSHWTQRQRMRNIRWVSPAVRLPPRPPQLSPRANQPSCRRKDGGRFRKPGARGCRCGRSSGSWGSTEPPSRNTWMPTVLQGGGPCRLSLRQHLIQWRHNRVTFMLKHFTGHLCWPSTP